MKLITKIIQSIVLDIKWLRFRKIPLNFRLKYVLEKYFAIMIRKKSINWVLGHDILYDNTNTPATLQSYPDEVSFVLNYIKKEDPYILDIGANIGQFATTTAFLKPAAKIYSFEPNPKAYYHLTTNTKYTSNVRCFKYAIGPKGFLPFYYVPGWSGKGSFIESNSTINLPRKDALELDLPLVELDLKTINELSIPRSYDLIKIDVEGFEMQVLNALTAIKSDYIYIEASMNRERNYKFIHLLKKLLEISNDGDLLYVEKIDSKNRNQTTVNILVGLGQSSKSQKFEE